MPKAKQRQKHLKEMDKINIYGASGHAKVIIDCIVSSTEFEVGYIFDDNVNRSRLLSYRVISPEKRKELEEYPMIFGIGNNEIRKKLVEQYALWVAPPVIHNRTVISSSSKIGEGSVVMPNAVLNADSVVGRHCIVNTAAIVEHDCKIGDFVHISPNASLAGGVEVGKGTHVGIGTQIIQGIKIGKWATIGAGAVILKDVPDGATVVGNPGRIVKLEKDRK